MISKKNNINKFLWNKKLAEKKNLKNTLSIESKDVTYINFDKDTFRNLN